MENVKNILLTNDDGYRAEGLLYLRNLLKEAGYNVTVAAPDKEMSATSHALTLHKPLRIYNRGENTYSIDGTPTDCVLSAVKGLCKIKFDMVIAGINHGANMGEDVLYSGTVAAAYEGTMLGIPSVAISLVTEDDRNDFSGTSMVIPRIIEIIDKYPLPPRTIYNINIPSIGKENIKGVKLTKPGTRVYSDELIKKIDPRGKPYYWIGGKAPSWEYEEGTDFSAVYNGYISITPIYLKFSPEDIIDKYKKMEEEF